MTRRQLFASLAALVIAPRVTVPPGGDRFALGETMTISRVHPELLRVLADYDHQHDAQVFVRFLRAFEAHERVLLDERTRLALVRVEARVRGGRGHR